MSYGKDFNQSPEIALVNIFNDALKQKNFSPPQPSVCLNSHIKTITNSAYYHIWNISRITRLMSQQDLEKLVSALISSQHHCTGVFTGLSKKKSIRQLQPNHDAATGILTKTKRVDHISPVLRFYTDFLSVKESISEYCCWFIKH